MRIGTNVSALNSWRNLNQASNAVGKNLEKLSSGLRINRAGDDAAGLAISEKMRGQIRGLNQAARNAQDGISMIQTAESALNETHAILQRMRELAVQAANGTYMADDLVEMQLEVDDLIAEIDRIAEDTKFNTLGLNAADGTSYTFQVGTLEGDTITVAFADMTASGLRVDSVDLTSGAGGAITAIDAAIKSVSDERAQLGAKQNRLEHTISNLNTASESLSAAEGRIRDVDMAQEMVNFTKNNILAQSSTAMLAQANQLPQLVLQLLR